MADFYVGRADGTLLLCSGHSLNHVLVNYVEIIILDISYFRIILWKISQVRRIEDEIKVLIVVIIFEWGKFLTLLLSGDFLDFLFLLDDNYFFIYKKKSDMFYNCAVL